MTAGTGSDFVRRPWFDSATQLGYDLAVSRVAMLELAAITAWVIMIAAIVIFVQAVVRISESFAQISRSLEEIARTLREGNVR
jgi:ABC-type Fe3+ transport system permease subunit